MGPSLFGTFLDQRVENIQECLVTVGVNGILHEFECWLDGNNLLHPDVRVRLGRLASDHQRPDEDGAL